MTFLDYMWYRALVIVGATGARAPADIQQWVPGTRPGKGAILKNSKKFYKTTLFSLINEQALISKQDGKILEF